MLDFRFFKLDHCLRVFTLILVALFLVTSNETSFAQSANYKFSHININDGLSNNQVTCIYKDRFGFMWFGTMSGLNRYDGYELTIFEHDIYDTTTLSDNFIIDLFEDHLGKLWVYTRFGLNVYDPAKEKFIRNTGPLLKELNIAIDQWSLTKIFKDRQGNFWYLGTDFGINKYLHKKDTVINIVHRENDGTSIASNTVISIVQTSDNYIWLIHANGIFEKFDPAAGKVVYRSDYFISKSNGEKVPYELYADNDNDIWVYTNDVRGVFYFHSATRTFRHISTSSKGIKLNNDLVRGVAQDENGLIWIGTDHGGVNLFNKKDSAMQYILHNKEDARSLCQNSIISMFKDDSGIIWIGTFKKGISYYHENIIKFPLYKNMLSDPGSLPFDDINAFEEDEKRNLWIAANGGGLIYFDRRKNTFKTYRHEPENPESLSNDVALTLLYDSRDNLWIGTYYGGLNKFDGEKFTRYLPDSEDDSSISDDKVVCLFEDSKNNLWVGTIGGGLDLLDRNTNTFTHFNTKNGKIRSDFITSIAEDHLGNLWVCTAYGLAIMNRKTGKFKHYLNDINDPNSLSNNNVHYVFRDSRNLMWIGTREGLNLYNRERDNFTVFRVEDGLPENSIFTIEEDNNHNLWLGTSNGLSNIIVVDTGNGTYNFTFKNYDESDGLQGKEFNVNAVLKTSSGELVFGGGNGINIFNPADIKENRSAPKVVLTDFQVFNSSLSVGEMLNDRQILKESITIADEVVLKHDEKIFSIEFAALNYFHPEKNKYEYKLQGFNDEWITADAQTRKATYTNLDPGEYVFKVKASNNDGVWNEEGQTLKITILPPFWRTGAAFFIYFVVVAGVLLLSRKMILDKERMNFKIEQERSEAKRMHELDMMKIRFFTNISHEFRTPLMLVISPLENVIRSIQDIEQKKQILLVSRNAKRLLKLVNQLLDFRKMEVEEFRINPAKGDVVQFIREITESFSDLVEKNKIDFAFWSQHEQIMMMFDHDKLEKIMFNLLSNAFKFTPEHSSIHVELKVLTNRDQQELSITVKDTGIGIPEDMQEKIFERFFQNETSGAMVNQGSGIGLSLTKEFVKLHGGTISVESTPHRGSCFTVLLPIVAPEEKLPERSISGLPLRPGVETPRQNLSQNHKAGQKKPLVLLVEDNEDFRFYLKDNLKGFYNIIEAANGKDGWEMAVQEIPDLIVSDIAMPEMNGIALCEKIKNNQNTSHIPVILLSAHAEEEQKLKGFETGADDYITKPFNFEILQFRIRNMIILRETYRRNFNSKVEVNPKEISITSLDESLIQKALDLVENNMANPDFTVEELSRELGMSRVHLYKKLSSLTGKTPIEFIRVIRLKRAAQLLEKSQLNVAEVAYKVGFNNPKYFTKYFKAEFKTLPSAYAERKRKEDY